MKLSKGILEVWSSNILPDLDESDIFIVYLLRLPVASDKGLPPAAAKHHASFNMFNPNI